MIRTAALFVTLAMTGLAQSPADPLADAMLAMTRQVARHPVDDGNMHRTMALVLQSAKRLGELEKSDPKQAAAFETELIRQLRLVRSTLDLLGSDALVQVRQEMLESLDRAAGQQDPPAVRFLSAVLGKDGPEAAQTFQAFIEAMKVETKRPQAERIISEAGVVLEMMGPDRLALESIRQELRALTN